MWYIFPQITGLGYSEISQYYAINNINEAIAYMENDILKNHMQEICQSLLDLESGDAQEIFGWPDNLKLHSSMTLFSVSYPQCNVFNKVLGKFFDGELDVKTLELIKAIDNIKSVNLSNLELYIILCIMCSIFFFAKNLEILPQNSYKRRVAFGVF